MPSPTLSQLMQMGYFRPRSGSTMPQPGFYRSGGRWSGGLNSLNQYQDLMSTSAGYDPAGAGSGAGYRYNPSSRSLPPAMRLGTDVKVRGLSESAGQPGGADTDPSSWLSDARREQIVDAAALAETNQMDDAGIAFDDFMSRKYGVGGDAAPDPSQSREKENAGSKQNDSSSSQTLPQFVRKTPTAPASGPGAYARGEGPFYQGGAFSGPHSAGMSFLQSWLNNSFGAGSRGYGGKSPGDPSNKGLGLSSTGGEGWAEGSGIGGASGEAGFEAILAGLERRRGSGGGTGAAGGRGYSGRKSLPKRF